MSNYINQYSSIFSGSSVERDADLTHHCIVTDHPYMHQLGLSAFTTGDLYTWISQTDSTKYINLQAIGISRQSSNPLTISDVQQAVKILMPVSHSQNPAEFKPWRNIGYGGKYENLTVPTWRYYNTYSYNTDLNFVKYDHKKARPNLLDNPQQNIDTYISNIIVMNDYVRYIKFEDPTNLTQEDKAVIEFIEDIKTSKNKCIEWSGVVPFHLNLPAPIGECVKNEMVSYKLFLFDEQLPREDARKIALNEFVIVSDKVDAFGRVGSNEDGRLMQPNVIGDLTETVAASIDLTYNDHTLKWESGTQQKLAMIVDDIPAAKIPDIDTIKNESITNLIETSSVNNTLSYVTVGSAIPLIMHNGNPLQFGPTYMQASDRVYDADNQLDERKLFVKIFNRSPRAWSAGEVVVISKIDGVWQPIGLGESTPQIQTPAVDNNWDFTYLSTNSMFYFRSKNLPNQPPKIITYTNYEEGIRQAYYYDDVNNASNSKDTLVESAFVENSYFQYTSWDFMSKNLGGLRDKNALACTQTFIKPDGQPLDGNGRGINGTHTAPFFGCVFPDGYDTSNNFEKHKQLPTAVKSTNKDFFNDIDLGTNLYENLNDNTGDSNAGGMFVNQSDNSLRNLPADIALNSSPSSDIGSPVQNILIFDSFIPTGTNPYGQPFRKNIRNIFSSDNFKNWLYFEDDVNNPCFNFKPVNNNVIQFRPLKIEVYSAFETYDGDNNIYDNNLREIFSANAHKIAPNPIHITAFNRNNKNNHSDNKLLFPTGLKWNKDIVDSGPEYDATLTSNDTFGWPRPIFEKSWMADPARPAGGIGIIGASVSVTANNSIDFITDNYIGIRGWLRNNFWNPSHGSSQNYFNLQTTQLFVRIFQKWPKNQTIYDPRFFSVFHFNPGVDLALGKNGEEVVTKQYFEGSQSIDKSTYDQKCQNSPCENYPDGLYTIDNADSSVDIRIPTYLHNVEIPLGEKIYSDSSIRSQSDGKVDTQRRGKLLPYNYKYKTLGFRSPSTILYSDVTNEKVSDFDILIFDGGAGYSASDVFTLENLNGNQVKLYPVLNTNNSIINFTLNPPGGGQIERGSNYSSSIFQPEDKALININFSDGQPIVEFNKISSGSGLKAIVLRCEVIEAESVDEKPKDLGILKLTPNLDSGQPKPSNLGSENFKETDQTFSNSLILEEDDKSLNNKYDLFFHFHNDVSHTLISDYGVGLIAPLENQVTLTINVT